MHTEPQTENLGRYKHTKKEGIFHVNCYEGFSPHYFTFFYLFVILCAAQFFFSKSYIVKCQWLQCKNETYISTTWVQFIHIVKVWCLNAVLIYIYYINYCGFYISTYQGVSAKGFKVQSIKEADKSLSHSPLGWLDIVHCPLHL